MTNENEQEYVCPGCVANDMAEECCHDAKTWALAEALSVGLPGGPADWGTPTDRAWAFIDDAEAMAGRVGAPPYAVAMFHPGGRPEFTTVGLVNGRYLFAVPDDGEAELIGDVRDDSGRAQLILPGSKGVALIATERDRQHAEEGYTAEHDRGHAGQLALAGVGYAAAGADDLGALGYVANDPHDAPFDWPWHPSFWKPTGDAKRDLVKAGALIAAAIDSIIAEEACA